MLWYLHQLYSMHLQRQKGLEADHNIITGRQSASRLYYGLEARQSTRMLVTGPASLLLAAHLPKCHRYLPGICNVQR